MLHVQHCCIFTSESILLCDRPRNKQRLKQNMNLLIVCTYDSWSVMTTKYVVVTDKVVQLWNKSLWTILHHVQKEMPPLSLHTDWGHVFRLHVRPINIV